MSPDFKSLIFQLQFGDPASQSHAFRELKSKGFDERLLNELKQQGLERKRRMMSQPPSATKTIKTVAIPTPSFVSDHLGTHHYGRNPQSIKPIQSEFKFTTTVQPARSPVFKAEQVNMMPIAQLGLSIMGSGADITLKVKNYDLLKDTFNSGRFIANYKGKKVWKMAFRGNSYVSSELVAIEKAAFNATFKTLKLVQLGGYGLAGLGTGLSLVTAIEQGNGMGWSKFTLDFIMTGVAFIPPYGWVLSGAYGIIGGTLDVAGVDWWGSFYSKYLVDADILIKDAMNTFEKLDQAHRKVTGVGIMSGPKL